ncbi:two-component regulator propeller domain-containing protein [Flexithrix dorotheae]|uniref:two-component regulator propeller domain-containing protein n=1 Tax=Flexithrix dorotheae TaxID=70993 RepID=UPI00037D6EE1|nr:two-component regulator propeller domain-containing protein [Flexithrix dorotheae]
MWCFLSFTSILFAQTYQNIKFKHFTILDGLSQNNVIALLQDNEGFIWIGTEDGVNKFDGKTFTIYRHNPDDSGSINHNNIRTIFEDSQKRLWIGSHKGLNIYNRKKDNFIEVLKAANITSIFEDSDGNIWFGSWNEGISVLPAGKSFRNISNFIQIEESLTHPRIMSIMQKEKSELWLGTLGGGINILKVNPEAFESSKVRRIPPLSSQGTGLNTELINDIIKTKNGDIYVGSKDNGLFKLQDPEEKNNYKFELIKLRDNTSNREQSKSITYINEDKYGAIWVSSENGLFILDRKNNKEYHYRANPRSEASIIANNTRSIINDNQGRVWIGSRLGGIDLYDPIEIKFFTLTFTNDNKGVSHPNISSIAEDENENLWLATDGGGLNFYDKQKKTFTYFQYDPNNPHSISSNKALSLCLDTDGIWVGTWMGGLNFYSFKDKKFYRFKNDPKDPTSISDNRIFYILKDSKGNIWVCTYGGGLNLFDRETKSFKKFTRKNNGLINDNLITMYEDSNNHFWIGTLLGGLDRFDPETFEVTNYSYSEEDSSSLSHDFILSILEDQTGNLLVGTDGGGLNIMNPQTGSFRHFRMKHGLPNDVIFGILLSDNGNFWLSTNKGLSRFNPNTQTFLNFDRNDGLQSNQFNRWAYHKGKSGLFYFGGIKGLNYFYPDSIKLNEYPPEVKLTNFYLFNKKIDVSKDSSVLKNHIGYTKEVKLEHDQSVFSIEFAALNYTAPSKNQFAYMLEGFDEEWRYIGTENKATYTNLDPGEYIFKVKASNNDGVWNEKGTSIKITIIPPWWQTLWFRGLASLGTIFLLLLIYFYRIGQVKKQRDYLEEQVKLRTSELNVKNEEISSQNEELMAQQKELEHQYEESLTTLRRLQEAQSQLIQSEKMASLGLLTAGIAHELNNPINYIKSGIIGLEKSIARISIILKEYELIDKSNINLKLEKIARLKKEAQFDEMVYLTLTVTKNIVMGAERSAEIIKGLKSFSRDEDNEFILYDIHQGLDSTLLLLNHLIKNEFEIKKDYDKVPRIYCLPGKLNQVFMNILTNSIQALENEKLIKNKKINITTTLEKNEEGKEQVKIIFTDNGPGIPSEIKNQIFEPFFTTKEVGEGTGLGLYISLNIIQKHQGKMIVQPNPETNTGTQTIISIPIAH